MEAEERVEKMAKRAIRRVVSVVAERMDFILNERSAVRRQ